MKRRDLIRATARLTGAALSAPLVTALMSGSSTIWASEEGETALHFFSETEFRRLRVLVDTLLPRTDSPSATDVGVPAAIDRMVGLVYRPDELEGYRPGHVALNGYLAESGFDDLDSDRQFKLLNDLDGSDSAELEAARNGFRQLKQQAVAMYLSSEEIAEKYLNYLPIPGEYHPCIPVSDVDNKAWAI